MSYDRPNAMCKVQEQQRQRDERRREERDYVVRAEVVFLRGDVVQGFVGVAVRVGVRAELDVDEHPIA